MKIIKYLVIIIGIITLGISLKIKGFLNVLEVYAYETWPSSQNINITVNDTALSTTSKVYKASGTHTFKIASDEIYIPAYEDENDLFRYYYGYISVCVSSSFTVGTFSSGYFSKNVKFQMTGVPCQMYNTTAYPDSVVMYITYELNQGPSNTNRTMCTTGASSTLCTLNNSFDISVPRNVEYTLNSYGFSKEPFIFDDTTSALINQNKTIINQNNQIISNINTQTTTIMETDHTYNNYASTNIPGGTEMDDYTALEDGLLDNLDFSGVQNLNVGIDPNANNFIWEIVNRLRTIPGVLLMMTSALGLGLMKMILNR